MKTTFYILLVAGLVFCGCSKTTHRGAVPARTDTYEVELKDGYIRFVGIDHPSVTTDIPGDKYETGDRIGRHNVTRFKRCCAEANKAIAILSGLVKTADTPVLLNSFRPSHVGEIDEYVSINGNWIIAEELCRRRPLPQDLVRDFESQKKDICLGPSGPPPFSELEDFLDMAARQIEYRKKQSTNINKQQRFARPFIEWSLGHWGQGKRRDKPAWDWEWE